MSRLGAGGRRLAPVQTVIFDWGGTITPWRPVDLSAQWLAFARAHPGHAQETEVLARRILEVEGMAWRRGRDSGTSARLEEILYESGVLVEHEGHLAALTAYQDFWYPHTLTDPDIEPLWTGLRERGIKVGVLSNTIWTREYHRDVFARDGVLHLVDGDVYSSEIAHTKPHPEAFAAALAAVGVQDPGAAVYVGDRPYEDVHGAQQAGMRAVLVPHSDLPVDQQVQGHRHDDVHPDAVIDRLADLLAVVDGWR